MVSSVLPSEVRTLFISDLHLGYRVSHGDQCLDLLRRINADKIYLVGDVVDETRLSDNWYWPQEHQETLGAIVEQASTGTKVFLTPGNHDPCFRQPNPLEKFAENQRLKELLIPLLEFEVANELVYETLSGKRILILHGDLFDASDSGRLGAVRRWGGRFFDRHNWWLPHRAITLTRAFFKLILARPKIARQGVCDHARSNGFDGVIFGHLHEPEIVIDNRLIVGNCGDWITNRSCLVETRDGQLQLFNFGELIGAVRS